MQPLVIALWRIIASFYWTFVANAHTKELHKRILKQVIPRVFWVMQESWQWCSLGPRRTKIQWISKIFTSYRSWILQVSSSLRSPFLLHKKVTILNRRKQMTSWLRVCFPAQGASYWDDFCCMSSAALWWRTGALLLTSQRQPLTLFWFSCLFDSLSLIRCSTSGGAWRV